MLSNSICVNMFPLCPIACLVMFLGMGLSIWPKSTTFFYTFKKATILAKSKFPVVYRIGNSKLSFFITYHDPLG